MQKLVDWIRVQVPPLRGRNWSPRFVSLFQHAYSVSDVSLYNYTLESPEEESKYHWAACRRSGAEVTEAQGLFSIPTCIWLLLVSVMYLCTFRKSRRRVQVPLGSLQGIRSRSHRSPRFVCLAWIGIDLIKENYLLFNRPQSGKDSGTTSLMMRSWKLTLYHTF